MIIVNLRVAGIAATGRLMEGLLGLWWLIEGLLDHW